VSYDFVSNESASEPQILNRGIADHARHVGAGALNLKGSHGDRRE
jgi:hypothetical protein